MGTHRSRSGSALLFSVIAVMVVSILAAGFLQLALSVSRRLSSSSDTLQALNLAEAGLAEAYTGLAVARSGNVGSPEAPAVFGGGLLWVEAEEHESGLVELECTAMYGTGRAKLGLACEPVATGVASLGFFTVERLDLSPDVRIDSFDSSQGTYAEQLNTPLNEEAVVGSNGEVSIGTGDLVFGDVFHGPTGSTRVAEGGIVTGTIAARPELEALPAIELPPIRRASPVVHTSGVPLIVAPGEAGYESLEIGTNSRLILMGPLSLLVGSLDLRSGSEMVLDTNGGPIEMFVTDSLALDTGSIVSTTSQVPADNAIFVTAEGPSVKLGATSQFYGFLYAPAADVQVAPQYEIFGGLVCRALRLSPLGVLHYDLALRTSLEARLPLLRSWRVIELPEQAVANRIDPFQALDLDPNGLLPPGEAHEDQLLEVEYVEPDGSLASYDGPEKDFDWNLVKTLLYGARDGEAFFLTETIERAPSPPPDPAVDLVNSSMTSHELRDALLAAQPVSDDALIAASLRTPPMEESDLANVLQAHHPLADAVLHAAIQSASFDSGTLRNVLEDNSPLAPDVLDAVQNRIPPLSLTDLLAVLSRQ